MDFDEGLPQPTPPRARGHPRRRPPRRPCRQFLREPAFAVFRCARGEVAERAVDSSSPRSSERLRNRVEAVAAQHLWSVGIRTSPPPNARLCTRPLRDAAPTRFVSSPAWCTPQEMHGVGRADGDADGDDGDEQRSEVDLLERSRPQAASARASLRSTSTRMARRCRCRGHHRVPRRAAAQLQCGRAKEAVQRTENDG